MPASLFYWLFAISLMVSHRNSDARLMPLVTVTRTCMLMCGAARPSWSRTHTARTHIYAYTQTHTHTCSLHRGVQFRLCFIGKSRGCWNAAGASPQSWTKPTRSSTLLQGPEVIWRSTALEEPELLLGTGIPSIPWWSPQHPALPGAPVPPPHLTSPCCQHWLQYYLHVCQASVLKSVFHLSVNPSPAPRIGALFLPQTD